MKVHDFDIIERKLHMQTSDSKHHHAWIVYDGITVARTKRSHGNSKFIPEHLIRKQLHVNQEQFAGLQSCSVTEEAYFQILIEKGIITPKQRNEAATQKQPKS